MRVPLQLPIYLDHHATTPVDPRVLEQMMPYFTEKFGNAASKNHLFGRDAAESVEAARDELGKVLKARSQEVIFTSGATESINLAIKGIADAAPDDKDHFITVATEHKAVLDCHTWLARQGYATTILPVDSEGLLDPDDVARAITPRTRLVNVMAANNEIGVIQDIAGIGAICREHEVYFMSDATQAVGKIPIDVSKMNIDLLACSAHKLYGPKGVGALFVRRSNPRVKLRAMIDGGGHERNLRSGTLNVPGLVGFGAAARIAAKEMKSEGQQLSALRDQLEASLLNAIPGAKVNGSSNSRLPGNLNISFPRVESEALMIALKNDVAVSSGSACTTAAVEPSHVLSAIGCSEEEIHASIRFGLGRSTHIAEVEFTAERVEAEYNRLAAFRQNQ